MVKIGQTKKPSKVCAIDASTNSLAFAIFDDKELVSFGKINFEGRNNYAKVSDAARKTIQLFKMFEIDAIVIEHTVFMNSPKTAADLALVQGALLGSASVNGIKIAGSVAPITWQIYINNGKFTTQEKLEIRTQNPGKSDSWYKGQEREIRKNKTINFVNTYYDRTVTDNDVADSIGIGHWAIHNWDKVEK